MAGLDPAMGLRCAGATPLLPQYDLVKANFATHLQPKA